MEKLYLLRHKRCEIYGPLARNELKNFLSEHHPLKDWELCGNLSSWVFIEKEDLLKKSYAEVWTELHDGAFSWKDLFFKKK